ncbi:MAG: hypothetical protein ACTSVY_08825 [Candidatus Helarchaeota archaeon]
MSEDIKKNLKQYYIKIIIILLIFGLFRVIANLIVYSIASQGDFYANEFAVGTLLGGIYKALITLPIAFSIPLVIMVIIFFDWREVREFKFEKKQYSNLTKFILISSYIVLSFISIPWLFAINGIYVSDVPILNLIFIGRQPYEGHPSVHLGEHHGFGGWFFITIIWILLYSRLLDKIQAQKIKKFVVFGLSFLFYFSLIQLLEDGINEQLVKRGLEIGMILYPTFHFLFETYILIPSSLLFGFCTLFLWNKYFKFQNL